MREPHGERRRGSGGERGVVARDAPRGDGHRGEEREQQGEADEAELGEVLELDRVRVAGRVRGVALAQPRDAEAARADAR